MKTVVKLILSIIILASVMVMSEACKKEDLIGYVTIKMIDTRDDSSMAKNVLAAYVEIVGANINVESKGWINVPVKSETYDLFQLQRGTTITLVNDLAVPPGKINQMRLLLGNNNKIVTTEETFPLKVPSNEQGGLTIDINQTIKRKRHLEIILDFDSRASIIENGPGDFSLKPVVKIKSATQL